MKVNVVDIHKCWNSFRELNYISYSNDGYYYTLSEEGKRIFLKSKSFSKGRNREDIVNNTYCSICGNKITLDLSSCSCCLPYGPKEAKKGEFFIPRNSIDFCAARYLRKIEKLVFSRRMNRERYQEFKEAKVNKKKLLLQLWELQGKRCYYCRKTLIHPRDADGFIHLDHIVPRAKNGKTHPSNLAVCCKICNQEKASKTVKEYMKVKRRECGPEWVGEHVEWITNVDEKRKDLFGVALVPTRKRGE